jgi:4-carboxymuconolactone decarboxylase
MAAAELRDRGWLTMARVPYPHAATLSPETRELLGRLPPLNVFRMLAGGEGLLRAFSRFGDHLLNRTALDPVLREIAILRVGVLSNARYELQQHEEVARRIGMTDELIAAVHGNPDGPVLDEHQRLVIRFTDDVVRNVRATDTTFEAVRAFLTVQELNELTMTIGFYMAVARYLETFDVDLEDTAPIIPLGRDPGGGPRSEI